MKKQAAELKQGEKIRIAGKLFLVESIELSEIGKQGRRKCRIEAKSPDNQKIIIVRPDNYPVNTE